MRNVLCLLVLMLSIVALAQNESGLRFLRDNCMTDLAEADTGSMQRKSPRKLRTPNTQWDAGRTYRQAVILVAFADRDFADEHNVKFYESLFNEKGYNQGVGPGCVADYFRDQSNGLFNLEFDIYGPVNVGTNVGENGNYGGTLFHRAAKMVRDTYHPDFSPYDWDGDGWVDQLVFVYAGYGGNEAASVALDCIWPSTGMLSTLELGDNLYVNKYSASAENWSNDCSCGIGTICHEFSHALGLPDLYPTSASSAEYSVVDEWDLMDGGNFVNSGWCPPNYSAHEKMQLGWLTPQELTGPITITGVQPVSEGGTAYIVHHTETEFFLLENRQWTGWDQRTPGCGLVISHVDYLPSAWSGNYVNNMSAHHHYDLVHADNLNYMKWDSIVGLGNNPHVNGHSRFLSGTPYPFEDNHELTDTSTPAATTFAAKGQLSKPITGITMTDDGVVSFLFMGGTVGVESVSASWSLVGSEYTIPGTRVVIQKNADGETRKVIR